MPPLKSEQFPGRAKEQRDELEIKAEALIEQLGKDMDELIDKAGPNLKPGSKYIETEKAEYQTEDQVDTNRYTRAWVKCRNPLSFVPVLMTNEVSKNKKGEVEIEGNEMLHFGVGTGSSIKASFYEDLSLEEKVAFLEAAAETVELIKIAQDQRQPQAAQS